MSGTFIHQELELINPSFDSPLLDATLELEHLRKSSLRGSTPPFIFFQLKQIFHKLESIGSARIEGNRTTVSQYISAASSRKRPLFVEEQLKEIQNLENALAYIDDRIQAGSEISSYFIRELQQIAVAGLSQEGDVNSGSFRKHPVKISGSSHIPPEHILVPDYMDELIEFINRSDPHKYDLIKVALVHHRFGWIHPFGNGNGRTVRLLTYAMLLKYGFNVGSSGRIINPTAVFCCDRHKYYEMLSMADTGTLQGKEAWCTYVLEGILGELRKLDMLADYPTVCRKILKPAIKDASLKGTLTAEDAAILDLVVHKGSITAGVVADKFGMEPRQATYRLGRLRAKGILVPVARKVREYCISLSADAVIYGVIYALEKEQMIPSVLMTSNL